jgi:hypothetical protein
MADGELQLLARDFLSLSQDARIVLETEFQRRGVVPEVDLHGSDPGQDVIEWDELVIIKQFRDLPERSWPKARSIRPEFHPSWSMTTWCVWIGLSLTWSVG